MADNFRISSLYKDNYLDLRDRDERQFNMLTVLKRLSIYRWCKCECGTEKRYRITQLRDGSAKSCGCLRKRMILNGQCRLMHGMTESRVYSIWCGIKNRCRCVPKYKDKGISVCSRWDCSFDAFLQDMGRPPSVKHSIDRIDNTGNYEPENCRWATSNEQQRNKSNSVLLTHSGITATIAEWAETTGISQATIGYRRRAGWADSKTLTEPVGKCWRTAKRKKVEQC